LLAWPYTTIFVDSALADKLFDTCDQDEDFLFQWLVKHCHLSQKHMNKIIDFYLRKGNNTSIFRSQLIAPNFVRTPQGGKVSLEILILADLPPHPLY
jgi:hypothetical protein